jgi:hypothetical protein
MSSLSCAEGGSHEHTLSGEAASAGGHSHGVTDPGHTHTIKTYSRLNGDGNNYSYWENAVAGNTGTATTGISIQSDGVHTHPFSAASKAVAVTGHTHTITGGAITGSISGGSISGSTANAGSGAAFDVSTVPACYKVIYIIKVV